MSGQTKPSVYNHNAVAQAVRLRGLADQLEILATSIISQAEIKKNLGYDIDDYTSVPGQISDILAKLRTEIFRSERDQEPAR